MVLSDRQIQLLKLMCSENEYRNLNYYAKLLKVTDRTIQNDIYNINKIDKENNINIDNKQNVGIKLNSSKKNVHLFLTKYSNNFNYSEDLDRRANIVKILGIEKKTVTYQFLSDSLYTSSTVLIKDINALRLMNVSNAEIVSDHSGTRLKASEYYTQKFIKAFFLDYIYFKNLDSNRQLRKNDLKKYFKECVVDSVFEIIKEIEDVINQTITDYYLISLEITILVLVERISRGNHFNNDVDKLSEDYLETLINFPFALEITNKLQNRINLIFNEEELRYISYQMFLHKIELDINNKYLESKFKKDVKELISSVSNKIGVDLNNDPYLYRSLMFHMVPLIFRAKSKIKIVNPLYKEVVDADAKLFYSIWLAVKPLEDKYDLTLSNDEVSFISIHFQVSLSRFKVEQRVYVVCEMGSLTSELLTAKLKKSMPSSLKIIPMSKKTLYNKDKLDSNFIITTVDLDDVYEPYIKVSLLMDDTDMRNIYDYYLKYSDNVYSLSQSKKIIEPRSSLIEEKFIFTNRIFENKNDLLIHAKNVLLKEQIVNNEFLKSVLDREKAGSTMISENVAMPHSNPKFASETKLLVYTLRKPIEWNRTDKAQLIFVLALSDKDGNKYLNKFLSIHEYVSNYKNVMRMLNMQKEEIKTILELL